MSWLSALAKLLKAFGKPKPDPPPVVSPPERTTRAIAVIVSPAIVGARVDFDGPVSASGVTNADGYGPVTIEVPGRYTVTVAADGYQTYVGPYDLSAGSPDLQVTLTPTTVRPKVLAGQFVIRSPYAPYGPRPGQADNLAFMAEIDVIWRESPGAAERIMRDYKALGGNHVMTGPVWANGYHRDYPDTNWLTDQDGFVRMWRWLTSEVAVSFVVAPDNAPYYDDRSRTFNWTEMNRLTDFYRTVQAKGVVFDRVVSQWEQFQRKAEARKLFMWMRGLFPNAERIWHNPPGHLSPGDGSEEERPTWESAAAAGIHTHYLQAHPPGTTGIDRAPIEQMKYDLWDMRRRMTGKGSPWGGPILAEDGQPIRTVYCEGTAYAIYNAGADPAIGRAWRDAALSVEGITVSLDGL